MQKKFLQKFASLLKLPTHLFLFKLKVTFRVWVPFIYSLALKTLSWREYNLRKFTPASVKSPSESLQWAGFMTNSSHISEKVCTTGELPILDFRVGTRSARHALRKNACVSRVSRASRFNAEFLQNYLPVQQVIFGVDKISTVSFDVMIKSLVNTALDKKIYDPEIPWMFWPKKETNDEKRNIE